MGTKSTRATGPKLKVLDESQAPSGKTNLRVRNVSRVNLAVPSKGGGADLFLSPQEEKVIEGVWAKNPHLRAAAEQGEVQVEWVESTFAPRPIPNPELAPEDLRPENNLDRHYAQQISLSETVEALRLIKAEVLRPDTGEPDARFLKGRMWRILRLARWIEQDLQNRRAVLAAISRRLDEIRAL